MGILSDNEERSQRVTSVASQTVQYQNDIKERDQEVAAKAENLTKMYNTLMKAHQVPTLDHIIEQAANALSEDQKKDFLAYLETTKSSEGYKNLVSGIVGSLGVDGLWMLFKLPARMSIMEFLKAVATPRATISRSVLAFLRERLATQAGAEAAAAEARAIGIATAEVEEGAATTELLEEAAMASRIAAVEEIAAGSRFLALTGWGLVVAAASFAIEAGVEAVLKHKYTQAEHQACLARLTCRYLLMLLDATKEVINHMEVVVDLIEANSDGSSEKLAQKVDEKRKEVNNELSEKLKSVSYEAAWDELHAKDTSGSGVYLNDELPKEELIRQAQEAAKEVHQAKL